MLFGLWLGEGLVSRDQQQSCVHDCSTSKHSGHERVVTGAIDKGDVSGEDKFFRAVFVRASHNIRMTAFERFIAGGSRALEALVELSVCITQLNRDVS